MKKRRGKHGHSCPIKSWLDVLFYNFQYLTVQNLLCGLMVEIKAAVNVGRSKVFRLQWCGSAIQSYNHWFCCPINSLQEPCVQCHYSKGLSLILSFYDKTRLSFIYTWGFCWTQKTKFEPVAENTTQDLGESSGAHIICIPFIPTNCDEELM